MKGSALALALLCWWSLMALADVPTDERTQVAALFEKPCQELKVSEPLVRAIARIESGLNPWTLNIAGRSYFFNSKEEALAKVRESWSSGRSIDVGLMQVNRWWLERYSISLEAALDPLANIYLGGWILKQELERHKTVRAAVGAYHSPNRRRAGNYADQVMNALESGAKQPSDKSSTLLKPWPPASDPQPPAPMKVSDITENQSMKVRPK